METIILILLVFVIFGIIVIYNKKENSEQELLVHLNENLRKEIQEISKEVNKQIINKLVHDTNKLSYVFELISEKYDCVFVNIT